VFVRVLLLWLISFLSAPALLAASSVELYLVDYPPYTIVDGNQLSGIDVEVSVAAFAASGVDVKLKTAPWKRIMKSMEHGRIAGVITCSKRPERQKHFLFSDALSEVNQVAVMRKERPDKDILSFSDLDKVKVSVVDSWSVQKELQQANIPHIMVPDVDSGIRSLLYRDIDVFYNAHLVAKYRAQQMGLLDKIKIKRLEGKMGMPYFLCLSKDYPKTDELLRKFNQGLQEIKANGQYEAIYERYL